MFTPGEQAAGIHLGVDDSSTVKAKLGEPEYRSQLATGGTMFMYPQLGMGVQIREGLTAMYHSTFETDSLVSEIVLFPATTIDKREFKMCTLRSPEGATIQSTAVDFLKKYGESAFKAVKGSTTINDQYTGEMVHRGMKSTFRDGKLTTLTIVSYPHTDSAVLRSVINAPIVPGVSLGGVSMGMTLQQVQSLLGPTSLKYTKLNAEFWYYPQYALKVQFGIPPTEGSASQPFFDTAHKGQVTAIIGIRKTFFEGEVCSDAFEGRTAQAFSFVGLPSVSIAEKLGKPLQFVSALDIMMNQGPNMSFQGIVHTAGSKFGRYPFYVYDGIAYFIDPRAEVVNHVMVTDIKLPMEMSY